jgi:hypothetical protein
MVEKIYSPNFWIVVDHPQQLATAIAVSRICCKNFGAKSNLIVSKHAYWRRLNFREYKNEFGQVHWFERLFYPPPSLGLLDQLSVALNLVLKLRNVTKRVKNLGIKPHDIIVGLSGQEFLENVVLSHLSNNKKVGVINSHFYYLSKQKYSGSNYRYSFGSFVIGYILRIFGMHEVIRKYVVRPGKILDGDTRMRYKMPLSAIYDYLIIMRNRNINYIDKPEAKIFYSRYPYAFDLAEASMSKKKKLVFLGDPFLAGDNIDFRIYLKKENECLDFIRKFYGGKFDLVYKPHPRWNKEIKILNLHGFKIYKGNDPAEIYLIKNRSNIHAVFSVNSTGSRSALNCGLPSYVLCKMFPYSRSVMGVWDRVMGGMPKDAYIKSFKDRPTGVNRYDPMQNFDTFTNDFISVVKKLVGYKTGK